MTHTPPSEAAASSQHHNDPWSEATPERLDQAARALTYNGSQQEGAAKHLLFVAGHRIESLLRMRAKCPPTAEVERLRAGANEANSLGLHLINIGAALAEAGQPHRHKGDELERIRDLARDRDAWKHRANRLGGDLNSIRSLVPNADDLSPTFDVIRGELQRLRDLAERNGKAATERGDLLARCGRAVGAKMDDDVPVNIMGRIPAEVERVVVRLRAELATAKDDVNRLRAEKREEIATAVDHLRRAGIIVGSPTAGPTDGVAIGMTLASAVGMLCDERAKILAERDARASLPAEAQTAVAAIRDLVPELAKAGIQVGPRCSHAEAVAQLRGARDRWRERFEAADKESGATAKRILAMCDLLAEAGFSWTGAESHAAGLRNAVNAALAELARLRKESKRDCAAKQQALLDEIARLFPGKGPLLDRVRAAAKVVEQDAIAERVCKALGIDTKTADAWWLDAMRRTQPKRDVDLAPIKSFVDEAIRKVMEKGIKGGLPPFGDPFGLFARRSCKEPKVIGEFKYDPSEPVGCTENLLPKSDPQPLRDKAGARSVLIDKLERAEAIKKAEDENRLMALQPEASKLRAQLAARGEGPAESLRSFSNPGQPFDPSDPIGPKFAPATGQPRTEVPVGPDGSGTVVELGRAFQTAMLFASPSEQSPSRRIDHLHAAVAELAKVVERIGGAK